VIARLDQYLALLEVWNRTTRLTGERDVGTIVRKHVIDSLAPAAYLSPRGLLADVGSGAGFPGIILACLHPEAPVVLIEARRRRASFLREVVRTLGLCAATVLEGRAEAVRVSAATVIARALRIDVFLPLAARLVAPGGQVLAMQTARTDPSRIASTARASGLVLADVRDYVLPGGERRRLLRFAAGERFSHPPAVC
jgi:16S rRNA (guanine527-N7)-methyltransferase